MKTTVELAGLVLLGRHGVLDEERAEGQRFVFDVWLDVPDVAAASDRIEDAVDYRDVAACVREVSDGRAFRLLEALATALADELLARFPAAQRVEVRVHKPDVVLDPPVGAAVVSAARERGRV